MQKKFLNYKFTGNKVRRIKPFFLIIILLTIVSNIYGRTLQLKLATFLPPPHPYEKFIEKVAKQLTELSNNKVKIKVYSSSSLGKAASMYEVTEEGLADISLVCNGYNPSLFPLALGVQLPFFGESAKMSTYIIMEMLKKGVFKKEFSDVVYLLPLITSPSYIFSKKRISKIEDFKGLRIVGGTKIFRDICKILGASSIVMSYPDVYLALQRDVVDAGVTNWPAAIGGWKWYEVLKYALDVPIMSGWHCEMLMNRESWEKVPDDVKNSWEKVFPVISIQFAKYSDKLDALMRKKAVKEGMEIVELSKLQKEKLLKKLIPIWKKYIKANGEDGKRFYRIYISAMKKLGKPVLIKIPGLMGEQK